MVIDYFTKRVEAKPLVHITEGKVKGFVINNIIYHFEISYTIIADNKRQFDNQRFRDFFIQYHINHKLTSVGHPQSNSKVEVINWIILHGPKIRLNETKGLWTEVLSSMLYAYRIIPRTSI